MDQDNRVLKVSPPVWMIGVGTVVAIFLIAFLAALTRNAWREHTFIGRTSEAPHLITISGEGKVTAIPDIAVVMLGMQTEKKSVADAQRENTRVMNELQNRLKALAIPPDDVTTSQYSVYPQYDWNDGRQTLRGYQVNQEVTVKIRDFDKISPVLALVGELGLNQVGGLNFSIDDPEQLRQEARISALAQAKRKAEALARAAGVRLGKIVSFSESGGGVPPVPVYALKGMGGDAAVAPEIAPGSQDVVIMVTVSYELE